MPVPEQQATIQRMRALRAQGLSSRKIATRMEAEGVQLSHVSVGRIVGVGG